MAKGDRQALQFLIYRQFSGSYRPIVMDDDPQYPNIARLKKIYADPSITLSDLASVFKLAQSEQVRYFQKRGWSSFIKLPGDSPEAWEKSMDKDSQFYSKEHLILLRQRDLESRGTWAKKYNIPADQKIYLIHGGGYFYMTAFLKAETAGYHSEISGTGIWVTPLFEEPKID